MDALDYATRQHLQERMKFMGFILICTLWIKRKCVVCLGLLCINICWESLRFLTCDHCILSNFITSVPLQPFPKRQILDSSKVKDFAEDNFIFDENSRKFSKRVEKLLEKEKSLVRASFSFSRSVFKRLLLQIGTYQGLFGKGLKNIPVSPDLCDEFLCILV